MSCAFFSHLCQQMLFHFDILRESKTPQKHINSDDISNFYSFFCKLFDGNNFNKGSLFMSNGYSIRENCKLLKVGITYLTSSFQLSLKYKNSKFKDKIGAVITA